MMMIGNKTGARSPQASNRLEVTLSIGVLVQCEDCYKLRVMQYRVQCTKQLRHSEAERW